MNSAMTSRVNSRSWSLSFAGLPFGPVTTFSIVVEERPTKAGEEKADATAGIARQRIVESFMIISSRWLQCGAAFDKQRVTLAFIAYKIFTAVGRYCTYVSDLAPPWFSVSWMCSEHTQKHEFSTCTVVRLSVRLKKEVVADDVG